jgi:hypothetical protein
MPGEVIKQPVAEAHDVSRHGGGQSMPRFLHEACSSPLFERQRQVAQWPIPLCLRAKPSELGHAILNIWCLAISAMIAGPSGQFLIYVKLLLWD